MATFTAIGSAVEHDTSDGSLHAVCEIDSTHWFIIYRGVAGDGFAQVFTVDGSGNMSEVGTGVEFDTSNFGTGAPPPHPGGACCLMDSTHVLVAWSGPANDGFARVIELDGSYNLSLVGTAALEFDTTTGENMDVKKLDATHAFLAWRGAGDDGFVMVLVVDGSWNVTAAGAATEFDATDANYLTCHMVNGDTLRWFVVGSGAASDGFAWSFLAENVTWTIAELDDHEYLTTDVSHVSSCALDTNHFLVVWNDPTAAAAYGQVMSVNVTTGAITAEGSPVAFTAAVTMHMRVIQIHDDATYYYCVVAYADTASGDGFLEALRVAKSGWAVSQDAGWGDLEFDTSDGTNIALAKISSTRVAVWWAGVDADGFTRGFDVAFAAGTAFFQTLDAAGVGAATMIRQGQKILAAAGAGASTIVRDVAKILATSGAGVATIVRAVSMSLAAAGTGGATIVREVGKILSAGGVGTATITTMLIFGQILNATATGTATVARHVMKSLSVVATGTAEFVKGIAKILVAAAVGTATLLAHTTYKLALQAVATGSATLAAAVQILQSLSVTVTGAASIASEAVATQVSGIVARVALWLGIGL